MSETKTNDELVAEFMGAKRRPNGVYSDWYFPDHSAHNTLKYHKSWDWLMPVVEKIVDLGVSRTSSNATVSKVEHFSGTSIICPLKGVYERVVEFIEWYNENKKDN